MIQILSAEARCALGDSIEACLHSWRQGKTGLIEEKGRLVGRIPSPAAWQKKCRYSAHSQLGVLIARRAVEKAGWSAEELRETWLFAASSRGNLLSYFPALGSKASSPRFSASNTLHSELAAAISIELGIYGPWQMQASGCSAGLDALGFALLALEAGLCERALVVAVDLPLVPALFQTFENTQLLAQTTCNDPLSPQTNGLHLGEAGAAITLSREGACGLAGLISYRANSDAYDSLMIPETGEGLSRLLRQFPRPSALIPHATGTKNHSLAEQAALHTVYGSDIPPLHLLKPFTGHTLGASGLLDVALAAQALPDLPANLPGLHGTSATAQKLLPGDTLLKVASAMGGHNAAVMLQCL